MHILALQMASQWNQHCASCIGALSFPIHRHTVVGRAVPECRPMSGLYGPRRPRPRASAVGTVDHPDGKGRLSTASGPNISQLSFTSGPKSRRAPGRPATLWPRRQGRVPGSARLSDGGADADAAMWTRV